MPFQGNVRTAVISSSEIIREGLMHILEGTRYQVDCGMSQNGQIQAAIETCTGPLLIIVTLNDAISHSTTIEASCNRADCKVVLLLPPSGCDRSAARLLEHADAVISEFTDAADLTRILDIVMLDMRVQSANLFALLSPGRFAAQEAITVDRSGFLRHGAEDPSQYPAGGRPRALSTSEMKVLRCLMNATRTS